MRMASLLVVLILEVSHVGGVVSEYLISHPNPTPVHFLFISMGYIGVSDHEVSLILDNKGYC